MGVVGTLLDRSNSWPTSQQFVVELLLRKCLGYVSYFKVTSDTAKLHGPCDPLSIESANAEVKRPRIIALNKRYSRAISRSPTPPI